MGYSNLYKPIMAEDQKPEERLRVCVCVCVSGGYKNCYRSSLEGSDLKLNWPGNRCRAEPAVREEAHPAGTQQQGTGEGLGLDSG